MIPSLAPEERRESGEDFLNDLRAGLFPQVACARRGWDWNEYVALLQRDTQSADAVRQAEADCETVLQEVIMAAAQGRAPRDGALPTEGAAAVLRDLQTAASERPTGAMVEAAKWLLAKRFPERWSEEFRGLPSVAPRGYVDLVADLQRYAESVEVERERAALERTGVQ